MGTHSVSPAQIGRVLMVGGAAAFLAVLFLDWRELVVRAGPVDAVAGSSGWADWGWVAGLLAFALLAVEGRALARHEPATASSALTAAALAAGMFGFAAIAFATGSVELSIASVVAVDTERVLWPAYAGLALSGAAAAGGVLALAAVFREGGGRAARGATPHAA